MMAFRVEKKDRFELSSRGTVFESAVEVQLLHRVIEDTAYDIVSLLLVVGVLWSCKKKRKQIYAWWRGEDYLEASE